MSVRIGPAARFRVSSVGMSRLDSSEPNESSRKPVPATSPATSVLAPAANLEEHVVLNTRTARLWLSTDMGAVQNDLMGDVSMLPTPVMAQSAFGGAVSPKASLAIPPHRIVSTSLVPDSMASPTQQSSTATLPLLKSPPSPNDDGLIIPKRGESRLARSGSVGTKRVPTTILHREPPPLAEAEPAEEYIANDLEGRTQRWKRICFLGKGSFSDVVLAANADTGFVAAVKVTQIGRSQTADAQRQSLERDIELLRDLPPHPAVMHLLAASLGFDRAVVVLPYCPGGDLFELVSRTRSRISCALVRRIFADIVAAVAFLHAHNVVHRDIKLENVLLDIPAEELLQIEGDAPLTLNRPVALLTDMGLARRIDPEHPLLTTRCGSEDYIPPELLLGQPYDGRKTDSWALGVLLYAILEGRLPFDPPPTGSMPEGARARLRSAHRIARVDWAWYHRRVVPPEWEGAKLCVEAVLRRQQQRFSAHDLLFMPWVVGASPAVPLQSCTEPLEQPSQETASHSTPN